LELGGGDDSGNEIHNYVQVSSLLDNPSGLKLMIAPELDMVLEV
jgi:hypothetical protein